MTDSISADDKAIGFDYQYYYFLYKILTLKKGETVGLEVKDDVHTELSNDHQLLVQVKHTVQKKANGKLKNLTTLDSDLWKTLSNWSKIIVDKGAGRADTKEQLEFVRKTKFLLTSNKSEATENLYLEALDKPELGRKVIENIHEQASGETTKKRINDVLSLADAVLVLFLKHQRLELNEDSIIQRCKNAIEEKQIPPHRIDDLFAKIDSSVRESNFITVRAGDKVIISYDDFNRRYRRFFDLQRSDGLVIQQNYKSLPKRLKDQTFIKQLLDINDIKDDDIKSMTLYTQKLLTVEANLEHWLQHGDLTEDEINRFMEETSLIWNNKFRAIYRKEGHEKEQALNLLDAMREERLSIAGQQMDVSFSNGEYYRLSDIPMLGWLKNWEEKYK